MTSDISATTTDEVRSRYGAAALTVLQDSGEGSCGESCCTSGSTIDVDASFGSGLYDSSDLIDLPDGATLASLGCGNPPAVAELATGERVLDLGSGGGSTYCCRHVGWGRRASCTGST